MSKLGFGQVAKKLVRIERQFLTKGVKLAQKEFKENFESESNAESGNNWEEWQVEHPGQTEILVKEGNLKDEALNNKPVIVKGSAILTIDPTDDRDRNYADYHQHGSNYPPNITREFVTQSSDLDIKQLNLLRDLTDKAFT